MTADRAATVGVGQRIRDVAAERQRSGVVAAASISTIMSINGVSVRVSPHEDHSPGYWLHGQWTGGWNDSLGLWHPWQKGDRITVRVEVRFFPTGQSGLTEGSCNL